MAFSVVDAFPARGIPSIFCGGYHVQVIPDAYTPEAMREIDALEQTTAALLE